MFWGKRESPTSGVSIPVLCKFWCEDGVWNGAAEHLPVAAFGETFEEAKRNLANAVVCHFESANETGRIDQLVSELQGHAREHLAVDEISYDSPLVKMLVALKDREVFAVSAC